MKGPCAGLRGRNLTFIWGQGEEGRLESRDGTGRTGCEDKGEEVMTGWVWGTA